MAAGIAVIATVAGTDTAEIAADPDTADPDTADPVTVDVDSTAAATVVDSAVAATVVDSAAVVTAVDLVVAATVVGLVAVVTAADSVAAATWVAAAVVVTGKFSSLPSSNKRHVCFGRRAFFHWSKASALPPCTEHPIFCAGFAQKMERTACVSY